jgi:hypothetical protein
MSQTAISLPTSFYDGPERRVASTEDPVAVLLQRIHLEMIALAEGVMAIQTALSPLFAIEGALDDVKVKETQRLDLMEQTLRALADIATRASESTRAGPLDLEEITRLCRLSDLADRLRGGTQGASTSDGSLELF